MNIILSSVKCQFALVKVDDVVMFYRAPRALINYMLLVLSLSKKDSVTLKLKNYLFSTKKSEYSGHSIPAGQLEVVNHTIESIRHFKILTETPKV